MEKKMKPLTLGPIQVRFSYDRKKKIQLGRDKSSVIKTIVPIAVSAEVTIKHPTKEQISTFSAVSKCSPRDNFNKEVGRKLALSRALESETARAILTKEDRKNVWEAYRTLTKNPRWMTKLNKDE